MTSGIAVNVFNFLRMILSEETWKAGMKSFKSLIQCTKKLCAGSSTKVKAEKDFLIVDQTDYSLKCKTNWKSLSDTCVHGNYTTVPNTLFKATSKFKVSQEQLIW